MVGDNCVVPAGLYMRVPPRSVCVTLFRRLGRLVPIAVWPRCRGAAGMALVPSCKRGPWAAERAATSRESSRTKNASVQSAGRRRGTRGVTPCQAFNSSMHTQAPRGGVPKTATRVNSRWSQGVGRRRRRHAGLCVRADRASGQILSQRASPRSLCSTPAAPHRLPLSLIYGSDISTAFYSSFLIEASVVGRGSTALPSGSSKSCSAFTARGSSSSNT